MYQSQKLEGYLSYHRTRRYTKVQLTKYFPSCTMLLLLKCHCITTEIAISYWLKTVSTGLILWIKTSLPSTWIKECSYNSLTVQNGSDSSTSGEWRNKMRKRQDSCTSKKRLLCLILLLLVIIMSANFGQKTLIITRQLLKKLPPYPQNHMLFFVSTLCSSPNIPTKPLPNNNIHCPQKPVVTL